MASDKVNPVDRFTLKAHYDAQEVMGSDPVLRSKILQTVVDQRFRAKRYLDIGIGQSDVTLEIGALLDAREICGVDISDEAVFRGNLLGITAVKTDLNYELLPFEDGYFDFVTLIDVIEHLVDTDHCLSELRRVLAPEGLVLVSTPNLGSITSILSLLAGYLPPPYEASLVHRIGKPSAHRYGLQAGVGRGHIHPYNMRALEEHLEIYGLMTQTCTFCRSSEHVRTAKGWLRVSSLLGYLFSEVLHAYGESILVIARKN
jgi:2-polyprenyl-3-methyl-5-hydroxy-6-metoxy-1,4-benzoquinol methylase